MLGFQEWAKQVSIKCKKHFADIPLKPYKDQLSFTQEGLMNVHILSEGLP